MSIPEAGWWHALNLCLDGGLWKIRDFGREFGGPEGVFDLPVDRLPATGLTANQVGEMAVNRAKIDPEAAWARLGRLGIQAIAVTDPAYPPRLKAIHDAPPLIYVRGDASVLGGPCLAVVGSRKLTHYGRQVTASLVPDIAAAGATIVSGMALGADAAALQSCLDAGGKPVAVLASSLHYPEIAPKSNWRLAQAIERAGCLISENPPGRPARKQMFPLRNRVVSGLSQGVLVVEAALASGSLVTARLALEQNREVMAVPGSVFSAQSAGCLDLIRRGAACVTSAAEVAATLGWDVPDQPRQAKLNDPVLARVMDALSREPVAVTDVIAAAGLPAGETLSALTALELLGLVKPSGPSSYVKIR